MANHFCYLWVNSLYVSIISPLHLLNLKVGNFIYFRRSTYGKFLHPLTNFVALFFELSLVYQSGPYTKDSSGRKAQVLQSYSREGK